jgi:hypothetical protein
MILLNSRPVKAKKRRNEEKSKKQMIMKMKKMTI